MKKNITIIGAGLVGSLLSIYLAKRGYNVKIFESRTDMRKGNAKAGKSINLALSDRGIKALEEVGIMEEIKKIAIPMHGRFIHNTNGSTAYQPYGEDGQFINSVSRGDLNKKLMDLAEANNVEIFFNQKCKEINWIKKDVRFENNIKDEELTINFEMLFGSDGAYSAARLTHQLQHDKMQYEQYYIDFGYKELNIPAGSNGEFLLEKNALHIWPRGNFMLIALPNMDGSFTCTLFFPFDGEISFAALNDVEKLNHFFENNFNDVFKLMPTLTTDFFENPTSSLVTVKCLPWIREDYFALIGDAAHAIVPFFGQGMNCGFEDCRVLNKLMDKYNDDWKTILPEYEKLRKPDADAIAALALNNFVEMRDKVADPKFLLQKKIEANFSKKYPYKWIPAYSQVTFCADIRYSEAQKNSLRQEEIMQKIMKIENIETVWESDFVEQSMLKYIKEFN